MESQVNFHGYYIATAEDGDKITYTYEGSATTDRSKPLADKWKIVAGAGKQKGIKGSGTCAGKAAADGSAYDWECAGTYSIGMGK
jgi:hypothetical protein